MRGQIFVLFSAAAAWSIPWPDAFFHPVDAELGTVEPVCDGVLAQRLRGQRALVVGGTDGIGRATALALARGGASVAVAGRSRDKAAAALAALQAAAVRPSEQGFHAFAADLLTAEGCLGFTRQVRASGLGFDLVVLTVGMWPDRDQPKSSDGVDKVLALDVVARFLVTRELLPSLSARARVMSVLGSTVRVPPPPAEQDIRDIALGSRSTYGLGDILGTAGVLGDTWMQRMAALHPGITFIGTWPGVVGDDLVSHSKTFPWWLRPFLAAGDKLVGMPVEQAGKIHVQILTSPNAGKRAVGYFNVKLEGRLTNPLAYDHGFQQWTWEFLEELVANHTGHAAGHWHAVEGRGAGLVV